MKAQLRCVMGQAGKACAFHRQVTDIAVVIVLHVFSIGFVQQQIIFKQAAAYGIDGCVIFTHVGVAGFIARFFHFQQCFPRQCIQFFLGLWQCSDCLLIGNRQGFDICVICLKCGLQRVDIHIFHCGNVQFFGFLIQLSHQADIGIIRLHDHNAILFVTAPDTGVFL